MGRMELLPFRPASPRFNLWCDDQSLKIAAQAKNQFLVSGRVEHVFPLGTTLHFQAGPHESTDVPLALGSRPSDALRALTRALPRGIFVDAHATPEGEALRFTETVIPAASRPRVTVLTTDLGQRVWMLDVNQVELIGATRARCFITVLVDTRRTTLTLDEGTSAQATAHAIAARCPFGFRAEVEGNVVTFWKSSDSDRVAA